MKVRLFFLYTVILCVLNSCSKDDDSTNTESGFYALEVGNTWEYEVEGRNFKNEFELLDLIVTVTVTESTILNGEKYFTLKSSSQGLDACSLCENALGNRTVRDSLGYLVKPSGQIRFSRQNREDYFITEQDYGNVYGVLSNSSVTINTGIGTINAIENEHYGIIENSGEHIPARDKINYGNGLGMVYRTIFFAFDDTPLYKVRLKNISF